MKPPSTDRVGADSTHSDRGHVGGGGATGSEASIGLEPGEASAILDTAHIACVSLDQDSRVRYWNARAEDIFGWSREEAAGLSVGDLIVPGAGRDHHYDGLRRLLRAGAGATLNRRLELRARRRDGSEFPIEMTITAVASGRAWSFHAFVQDLSEARGEEREENMRRWFDMSNDLLCEASVDGYLTRVNGAWQHCLGFSSEELMARPYVEFVHPDDVEPTIAAAARLADGDSEIFDFENRYATKDGGWRWLLWSARSDGARVYAVAKDITDRKRLERDQEELLARVEAMARTDALTGLPNRRAWDEEVRRELSRARRGGYPVTVALVDLDHFKGFNDRNGHQAGDDLLREAGEAWRLELRESDFLARYGGEEFAVVLPDCGEREGLVTVDRLRGATPGGQTSSAGLALWRSGETAEDVMARADRALYRAKRAGRDRSVAAADGPEI